jgi:ribosome-associated protein
MPAPVDHPDAAPPSGIELAPGVIVPEAALRFSFSRSSGPGGQNVNKVSTRVELRVALLDIPLRPAALHRLARLAGRKVTDEGELVLLCDEHRSQPRNKAEALERLRDLILEARVEPKVRKATKPTKGSQRRRVEGKKRRGDVKAGRGRPRSED